MVEIEEMDDSAELRQRKTTKGGEEDLSNGEGKLLKKITQTGQGEVAGKGRRVAVHYTGKFLDGKVFDSSVKRGRPLEFVVGNGS
mmetsp:Transcript_22958/g.36571  ORF Transcript_22958/g.36571 Transcript_22958/m.36571 type:complete len:85 (-) Transcript_22958:519-773(-)